MSRQVSEDYRVDIMKFTKKRGLPPGFTLVEVMVSMVIALIVMGGVYRTLADEDINHDRSEKILDMQNNARVAIERIARDVRRIGSFGCGGTLAASTLKNTGLMSTVPPTETTFVNQYTAGVLWDGSEAILSSLVTAAGGGTSINFLSEVMGFNDDAAAGHDFYQEGTDALTLVYLSDERLLTSTVDVLTDNFTISPNGFKQDEILYITDCQNYSLLQKTDTGVASVTHQIDTGINNSNPSLGKAYGSETPARVSTLNTATYFIHNNGEFELCRNDTGRQIASNIEDLQFEFLGDLSCAGVACANGDGSLADEAWQSSPAAFTTERPVRAVRIWVLAMSDPDYGYSDTNNYNYPNSQYCAAAYNVANPGVCGGTGSPATLALASPHDGKNRHRYLASAVVYLRNAGLS